MTDPILIVDDEPTNLDVLETILGAEHRIVAARNGADAIRAAAKHHPAMIILDVHLPDMDGFEVCARIKGRPESEAIPVLFISASGDVLSESRAFQVGASDYIVKPIFPAILRARVRNHLALYQAKETERNCEQAMRVLAEASQLNDSEDGMHAWRMASYARALAEAVGWPESRCRLIEQAAPLHDLGNLGIPPSILRKPSRLDPKEWEVVRTHSRIGWELLRKGDSPLLRMAADIARHHHERWDGSGYPDGIAGSDIEEAARIVSVADVFDALSSRRPHRDPLSADQVAGALLEGAGTHFDPEIARRFLEILPDIQRLQARWNSDVPRLPGSRRFSAPGGGTARGG